MSIVREETVKVKQAIISYKEMSLRMEFRKSEQEGLKTFLQNLETLKNSVQESIDVLEERLEEIERKADG